MEKLPTVEAMLERQAAAWELSRRMAESSPGAEEAEGPWITISRQIGAGGNDLAQSLGEELGWQIFDREILSTIAEHTHTREAVLRRLDERAIGPLIDYISRLFEPELLGQTDFLREMLRVIWGLAKKGNAIILGRGANWFLRPDFGLRLRVVAPMEFRSRTIAELERVPLDLAEKRLHEIDARQQSFVRQAFGKDIADPLGYDLVLNLGSTDLASATQIVLTALRRRAPALAGK